MKRGRTFSWIPLWVDKWLWGSTRHELAHDERAVFVDLLALASKDDGFIRANPITPYPLEQLAGMLCAPKELLERTLSVSKKFGKIEEPAEGIYRIASWQDYQLSDRRKRDLGYVAEKAEPVSVKADPIQIHKTDTNTDTKTKNIKAENTGPFFELWKSWPIIGRSKKAYCERKFNALVKAGKLADFQKVTRGYFIFLDWQKNENNFEQRVMNLSTWLNNWEGEKDKYLDKSGNVLKPEPRL